MIKANIPFELLNYVVSVNARAAIIVSTANNVPQAFDVFFTAVKNGGIPRA